MSNSVAYKHYIRAVAKFPSDPLRPQNQFKDVIQRRITEKFLQGASADGRSVAVDERAEMAQVNALYSLLDDRYKRKYPVTGTLMKPASKPTYYTDLMRELDEAPQRSWWENTKNRWKGFIRFQ